METRRYSGFRDGVTGDLQDWVVDSQGETVYRGAVGGGPEATSTIDKQGTWAFPQLVDNHAHVLPTGLDLQKLNLGGCASQADVLDALRAKIDAVEPGQWFLAVHYDQTKFPDGAHLTRHDLDKLSSDIPILLRHVSGHASIANSAALAAASIDSETPNPPGGEFVRDETGALTGVLLESAHERVSAASPDVTYRQMVDGIVLALRSMKDFGLCAVADMMTGRFNLDLELQAYQEAAAQVDVSVRLYVQWSQLFGKRAIAPERLKELTASMNPAQCRIAGVKIFADGAIGSRTAAIYGQFEGSTQSTDDEGQLMYQPERLKSMVQIADAAGYQVAIHSIGDRSTDLVLDALELCPEPSKHRIEHAMMLSDTQIERLAKLNPFVSMQPEFLTRFGHAYLRQLGPSRASRLKRFRSVIDAGLRLSLSSDRPIVAGDPWVGARMAINRPEAFDPAENLTRAEAIDGYIAQGLAAMGDSAEKVSSFGQTLWLDTDPLGG